VAGRVEKAGPVRRGRGTARQGSSWSIPNTVTSTTRRSLADSAHADSRYWLAASYPARLPPGSRPRPWTRISSAVGWRQALRSPPRPDYEIPPEVVGAAATCRRLRGSPGRFALPDLAGAVRLLARVRANLTKHFGKAA
jgi:hypothetical protein